MQRNLAGIALAHYSDNLPHFPHCSNTIKSALPSIATRPKALASQYGWIEHNPRSHTTNLVFDLDKPESFYHFEDCHLITPNIIIRNPENTHCQYVYLLKYPVVASNLKSQKYLDAVRQKATDQIGADPYFSDFISKNALSDQWDITPLHHKKVELDDFSECFPSNDPLIKKPVCINDGAGRNVDLFNSLRFWAYPHCQAARSMSFLVWLARSLNQAKKLNRNFTPPLPPTEVASVAKSVANFVYYDYDPSRKKINRGKLQLENSSMSLKEKQSIAAVITNTDKTEKTRNIILEARKENPKATQKVIQETTSFSLKTIKRYWSKTAPK